MGLQKEITSHIRVVEDFPQQGISFKDLSPVFQNPKLSKDIIAHFAEQARGKVDAVCGIESRGFIFGFPIALALDLPFLLVRKKGKLPPPVVSTSYDLEYGSATLEVVKGQINQGDRILIHDDVLATGGTAAACAKLIEEIGGVPTQFQFLLELEALEGRKKLHDSAEIITLVSC